MTKAQLESRLRSEGFRADCYTLDGSTPPYEGYMLTEVHGIWLVQYFERGSTRELERFQSEEAACDAFYARLSKDFVVRPPSRPRSN
jgi:hypothetical protein